MVQKVQTLPLVDRLVAGKHVTLVLADGRKVHIEPEIVAGQLTGNYLSSVLPAIRYDDPRIILKETLTALDVQHATVTDVE
ncbi:hypothetical protein [Levilactobacillus spicheri]|uniref:Uncharacterized protein n=2 Tax=Levilactobacillus spicheri TaxID=216463 RepID=A0A0F3RRP5_9LACO|nr:hypothetical protein [Levilactobacillus spicheri]KJW12698.1 hypothetical protein VC81_07280 [Levilactobacillus spicheri]KRL47611.1 hypothetical protein FD37_GL001870 [Levilactobacillus spicheri DSM 15429]GEO67889.1 hypothetical protein LSP04_23080 [Levilactobacillus spicheri]